MRMTRCSCGAATREVTPPRICPKETWPFWPLNLLIGNVNNPIPLLQLYENLDQHNYKHRSRYNGRRRTSRLGICFGGRYGFVRDQWKWDGHLFVQGG